MKILLRFGKNPFGLLIYQSCYKSFYCCYLSEARYYRLESRREYFDTKQAQEELQDKGRVIKEVVVCSMFGGEIISKLWFSDTHK